MKQERCDYVDRQYAKRCRRAAHAAQYGSDGRIERRYCWEHAARVLIRPTVNWDCDPE